MALTKVDISLMDNATGFTIVTKIVTVAASKLVTDGVSQDTLTLTEGYTYKFDTSDATLSGHTFSFATAADAAGSTQYTTGVTTSGTPGSANAYTQIVVAASAPTLYYYCVNHTTMGGTANTPAEAATTSMRYKVETKNQSYTAATSGGYTTGDRTSSILVTTNISLDGGTINNFVDGAINHTNADGFYWSGGQNPSGWYVQFDFLSSKVISESKLYTYADGDVHGTWRWQATDDTSGSWTNIGNTFILQGASAGSTSHGVSTQLNGNTTAYRYYRLLGVSGSTMNNYFKEIEFKTAATPASGKVTRIHGTSLAWK